MPYRLYAMEIASLARKVSNPDLAAHYRRLAAAYMALARFHERTAGYGIPYGERVKAGDARPH